MKKNHFAVIFSILMSFSAAARGDDFLTHWVDTFETPETQQAILKRIFSDDVGSVAQALVEKDNPIRLFSKGGLWVRLGADAIYVAPNEPGGPYLVVSCMLYNKPGQKPLTASSYVLYDTVSKPKAISEGYAGEEHVFDVKLPKLDKRLVVLVDIFGEGKNQQWSGAVVRVEKGERVRRVWANPVSMRNFQFGFSSVDGSMEKLVVKNRKNGEIHYLAYRWDNGRFELDDFASESLLKALPDSVWQYGQGL